MRFFDLFSGIGGFRIGMQKAGFTPVGWIENDNPEEGKPKTRCRELYREYYDTDGEFFWEDVTTVDTQWLPDFEVLCAGFPCPSFSLAGRGKGFNDPRGNLFFEIMRVAKHKQPHILFLENVQGLLSNESGKTFETILTTMDELGYDAEWQLLNAKNFGLPQNRPRIFIIGYLRGKSRPQIFPLEESNGVPEQEERGEQREGARTQSEICSTIDARYGSLRNAGETYILHNIYVGFNEGVRKFENVLPAIRTAKGGSHIPTVAEGCQLKNSNMNKKNLTYGNCTPSIDGCQSSGVLINNEHYRRLTPLECLRAQGFPDDLHDTARELGISDTMLYKMAGNAVPPQMVEVIAKEMKELW